MKYKGEQTKKAILEMGVQMWNEKRSSVTATGIAHRLGMTHSAVLYHFPDNLVESVARYGFSIDDDKVICDLVIDGHPLTRQMTIREKQKRVLKVL